MTRPDRQDLRPGRPPDHLTCLHLGRDLQDQRSSGICLRLDVSPREPLIGQTEATAQRGLVKDGPTTDRRLRDRQGSTRGGTSE